jgi:hypothetical protein
VYGELSAVALAEGSFPDASAHLEDGERWLRAAGAPLELGKLLTSTVELLVAQGRDAEAAMLLDEIEAIAVQLGVTEDSVLDQRLREVRPLLGRADTPPQ